jgi:hypothetical protein
MKLRSSVPSVGLNTEYIPPLPTNSNFPNAAVIVYMRKQDLPHPNPGLYNLDTTHSREAPLTGPVW